MPAMRQLNTIARLLVVFVLMAYPGCRKKSPTDATAPTPAIIKTKTGIEMVLVPAGAFEMGSKNASPDESPVHTVHVSSFLMDRYEVTQGLYGRFPLPDPSHFKDPTRPGEQMNWADALEYCNERSLAEGLQPCYDVETGKCDFAADGYRLPTEAEWEYACRAGATTKYSFGNNAGKLKTNAWFRQNSSGKTQPVGQKKPNPWGLFDMHGNVKEWCNDYYSETYYKDSPRRDPRGPADGAERVLRGGAWNSSTDSCRSSYRAGNAAINDTCLASDAIGFRCVRTAELEDE